MLLRTALISGLVSISWPPVPAQRASADGITLPIAVFGPTAGPSVSLGESDAVVRVRLVEKLQNPASAASVSLPAGSNEVFMVEVKRSALSAQVLAAAFAVRSHLAARRSKHSNANIVVYIPANLSPRSLSPSEQLMFARLVVELQAHPPGGFIEVSGR